MRSLVSVLVLFSSPVFADDEMLAFLSTQGCTVGPQSLIAGLEQGISAAQLSAFANTALDAGKASRQGEYVVLDQSLCTIRMPRLQRRWSLDDPRIQATISSIDAYPEDPGCYLQDTVSVFVEAYPGDGPRAWNEYIEFIGSHIATGEVRFFSNDPLMTPVSFQLMRGACAEVLDKEALIATKAYLTDENFDAYIRTIGDELRCETGGSLFDSVEGLKMASELQGVAWGAGDLPDHLFNAWMFIEFGSMGLASGFQIDMSLTEKGRARPPACHYGN